MSAAVLLMDKCSLAEQSSCALELTRINDEYQQTFCEIRGSEVSVKNHVVKALTVEDFF